MSTLLLPRFGQHCIPLLSLPEGQGGIGGKAHLAAVKAACTLAQRIHGTITMAGRHEIVLVPGLPDFFDPAPDWSKARKQAWEIIRETPRLNWVIPTIHPEHIGSQLPASWTGKGFQNVCIGLLSGGPGSFGEKLSALRGVKLHHRMLMLRAPLAAPGFQENLQGIDWVIYIGTGSDSPEAARIGDSCRAAGVAFLFHRMDTPPYGLRMVADGAAPLHPFGERVLMDRPPLAEHQPWSAEFLALPAPVGMDSENGERVPDSPAETIIVPSATALASPDAGNSMDQPAEDEPAEDEPAEDEPAEDEPAEDEPAEDEPAEDEPAEDEPAEDEPAEGICVVDEVLAPVHCEDELVEFSALDEVVRRGLSTFIEVGLALGTIRERELWRAGGHESWAAYCSEVGGLTKSHANRLIASSEIARRLAGVAPIGVTPRVESQVRPLTKLKQPEQQDLAWCRATEKACGQPTASQVGMIVAEIMAVDDPRPDGGQDHKRQLRISFSQLRKAVNENAAPAEINRLILALEKRLKLR